MRASGRLRPGDQALEAQGTPFVPVAVQPLYQAPRANIDPDRSKSWLRRAMPIVLSHKWTFMTSLAMSLAGLILQVQIPKILQEALQRGVLARAVEVPIPGLHPVPLSHYVKIAIALAVGAGVAGYISRLFLMTTAYKIEFDLRNTIYQHLTRMSFPFYDRVQSGQLISRANSDIRSVQMYLTFAPNILVQCCMAVVAFGYMLSINVALAFVAMATMPFIYILGVRMRRSMFPVSWLIQSRLAEVATIVDENINDVRVVKSFAAEDQQLKSLARAADRLQWSYVKDADLRARFTPMVQNLVQLGLALVLLVGGYLVIHDGLPVGAILSFSMWIVMLQAPFQMLGMLIMMGQRAKASAGRIYEILDEAPTIVDRPGAVDLVECEGEVRFEDVTFGYIKDGAKVLERYDMHLRPGETVALVGRTGAGKSTVARLLARFYDVDEGAVRIDGMDVRDLTLSSLRAQVGIVLDEPFLFSASIRDNIAYGKPLADFADIEAAAKAAGADEFIRELPEGYDTVVGERGYTLSGGQRQRIAIARTLLVNPPILVLDDATSAIDVHVELRIHDGLRKLLKGRTTLIIAHRLSTISLADRVLLMDEGRIVAEGTHSELMATCPLYVEVLAQGEEEDLHPPDDAEGKALARAGAGRRGRNGSDAEDGRGGRRFGGIDLTSPETGGIV
ncbi:MAG TPA: ABC transporter ATP-binding protein [Acidimicrobiales bacterium]|nr:ABC transporter ATP-binding protein [Acidimicrobiales bacterium]